MNRFRILSLTLTYGLGIALGLPALSFSQTAPTETKWGEDTDGDGKDDHFYTDKDSDGHPDICEIDLDEDGKFEERWVDDNDDGTWNTQQKNPNDDNKLDSGRTDTDNDGKFDMEWIDADGDGKIDFDEVKRIAPVPVPAGPTPNESPIPGTDNCTAPACVYPTAPEGLGGYLPFEFYSFSQPVGSLAEGYFSAIGRCGELAGWAQIGGVGTPAVSIGGVTEVFATPGATFAFSISSEHHLAGMTAATSGFAPFFKPAGEPLMVIPTLGGDNGTVYDLDDGPSLLVGNSTATPGFSPAQPTVWEVFGAPGGFEPVPFALPTISSNGGVASAVNNAGFIVGSVSDSAFEGRIALWVGTPGAYDLVDLGAGAAHDINDHGVIVGTADLPGGISRAFATVNGVVTVLHSPIDCANCASSASGINERGEIVGAVQLPSGDSIAVYWPHAHGLPVVIADRIDEEIALEYEITHADSINDAGQILVAGFLGAEPLTFVLTPAGLDNPDIDFDGLVDACQGALQPHLRGDLNQDGGVDIGDPVGLLGSLFGGEDPPTCEDSADANDDGTLDIADAVSLLTHLFLGGPSPSYSGQCGYDSTPDLLTCETAACTASDVIDEQFPRVETPCDGAVLLSEHAYHECIGGTWHTVSDATYQCPDGSYQIVRTFDQDSGQPCP
ncbi:MAG: hypothetical protein AAF488_16580 [Planctomycetota bacterium]